MLNSASHSLLFNRQICLMYEKKPAFVLRESVHAGNLNKILNIKLL